MQQTPGGGYRAEIDGLRAIAIVSVVAYHIGVPGIPGGFAGVDVFFVVSGYLITTLLLKEQQERGSIDIIGFYARRARRLLPAFFVVLFASALCATFLLLPLQEEMGRFTSSVRYAAVYFSNIYFAKTTGGYFDGPIDLLPLLHTWSLAVEEQFYIGWPLLLTLAFALTSRRQARKPKIVAVMLAGICAVSFAINVYRAGREGVDGQRAFYMIQSRAWELGVGAGLAVWLPYLNLRSDGLGGLLCASGLAGLAAAFLVLDGSMAYPGTAALLPVLSTAAVIVGASIAPCSLPVRWLGAPFMVGVGVLSYGWYLWHWPFLAFARVSFGERALLRDACLAVAALILAWVTYVVVERPIRQRKIWSAWSDRRTISVAAAATGVLIATSLAMDYRALQIVNDPEHRLAHVFAASLHANPKSKTCNNGGSSGALQPLEDCSTAYPSGQRLMLWGDSHASHIATTVDAATAQKGIGFIERTRRGCSPVLDHNSGCKAFNAAVFREIQELRSHGLVGVIISSRWSPFANLEGSVRRIVITLTDMGLKVVLVGKMPEQDHSATWCVARQSPLTCSTSRADQLARRSIAMRALADAIGNNPLARLADPIDELCGEVMCAVVSDGSVLFRDKHHLSTAGAMRLVPWFVSFASWAGQQPSLLSAAGMP